MSWLVIGLGRADCGDDAAGPHVIERLERQHGRAVETRICTGGTLALLDMWQGRRRVVLVDAVQANERPGTLLQLDLARTPLPCSLQHVSTHDLGLGEAVEMARSLHVLPQTLIFYGIVGRDFAPGSSMHPEVSRACLRAAAAIWERIAACTNPA